MGTPAPGIISGTAPRLAPPRAASADVWDAEAFLLFVYVYPSPSAPNPTTDCGLRSACRAPLRCVAFLGRSSGVPRAFLGRPSSVLREDSAWYPSVDATSRRA